MKLFHLSDLHIGLKLINRDLYEDQKFIFDQIADYAAEELPDVIMIAGDIYDKAIPSAEAMGLFDYFLNTLREKAPDASIMAISGNHDNALRMNTYRSVLTAGNIHMIGNPPMLPGEKIEKIVKQDEFGPVNFYLLPFVKPSMVKQITGTDENGNNLSYNEALHKLFEGESVDTSERNVLVSHQFYLPVGTNADQMERMDSEIISVGNIDEVKADLLQQFDYAALGHIHKPMKAAGEFAAYCGTPLACSVSEAGQKKGIIMVELGKKGERKTKVLPLVPKRQVRVIKGLYQDVLDQGCEDYVTVILTDPVELNAFDVQERLRYAFPNLLEIRRQFSKGVNYKRGGGQEKEMDPYELCLAFLSEIREEEKEILQDVMNSVRGTNV